MLEIQTYSIFHFEPKLSTHFGEKLGHKETSDEVFGEFQWFCEGSLIIVRKGNLEHYHYFLILHHNLSYDCMSLCVFLCISINKS